MKKSILTLALFVGVLFAGLASAQTRSAVFTLSWTDASTNEDGFKLYRQNADKTFAQIGQTGANSTTFVAPAITAVEGSQVCFAVSAFNTAGESAKTQGCGTIPVTPVSVLPLVLESTTMPEYKALSLNLTKPVGASRAILELEVYDPDFAVEGELFVNGNGPIGLFGSAGVTANANKTVKIEYDLPLAWIVDGANKFRFSHTVTNGYRITALSVRFEMDVPGAPTALTIKAE